MGPLLSACDPSTPGAHRDTRFPRGDPSMNGFIKKAAKRTLRRALAGLVFGAGSMALMGCTQYRQHVDPCWPERYDNLARQTVRATFDAQAYNGHVLDQTIWNWDLELDEKGQPTDRLTHSAQDRLKYLIRRR